MYQASPCLQAAQRGARPHLALRHHVPSGAYQDRIGAFITGEGESLKKHVSTRTSSSDCASRRTSSKQQVCVCLLPVRSYCSVYSYSFPLGPYTPPPVCKQRSAVPGANGALSLAPLPCTRDAEAPLPCTRDAETCDKLRLRLAQDVLQAASPTAACTRTASHWARTPLPRSASSAARCPAQTARSPSHHCHAPT